MIRNLDQIVDGRRWHQLRVITRGYQVQVYSDARWVLDPCDKTFSKGRIGLWTKSDAITYIDELKLRIAH